MLQFGYAILPYFFTRIFLPHEQPRLGGSWFSLVATHVGGFVFWSGIFLLDYQGLLQGVAYALWVASLLPILLDIWRIVRRGWAEENKGMPEAARVELGAGEPSTAD